MDTELAWVQAARAGDERAFACIVARFEKPIYSLAYRMLGNARDAEDAAQETFLRAYRGLPAYDSRRPFATWLLSVAAHHCIDRLRRRHMREVSLDALPAWRAGCATVVDPQRELEAAERADYIARLLECLPGDYRLVVILRYWHDLGYAEIAEVTGDSESAVKSRLHRARRMLAQAMTAGATGFIAVDGGDPQRAAAAPAGGIQACSAMTPAA
jgi:RNA polymerase sigma-70 factor (ECF subfamily)